MSRILLFSRTAGYRHDSIEHAVEALTEIAARDGHTTEHTEDPGVFSARHLRPFDAVVWVSTSGTVLDPSQRSALSAWLHTGGAFGGIHSATACEYDWSEYEGIIGAVFDGHPEIQPALVRVADPTHPSTAHLPNEWHLTDEWYNFRAAPSNQTVLLTVDESTYVGGRMGPDHAIAWYGRFGAGRTWYTSLGHAAESYDDPLMRKHLAGGLRGLLDE